MELSIDTSTRYASVALSRSGECVAELTWRSDRNHSVELAPTIRALMARAGVAMGDVEAVFVAAGPGAFSALRVGMSLAKTLASALDVSLVSVGTLDVEAHPYLGLGVPAITIILAGGDRLYVGRHSQSSPTRYEVVPADGVAEGVESTTLFCGEGLRAVAETLRRRLGGVALIADVPPPTRRASVLAEMAYERLQAGDVEDAATMQPIYLRSAQITNARRTRATA